MRIPLSGSGEIETRSLTDAPLELPRIAPAAEEAEYRYVYAVGNVDRDSFYDCLHRIDVRDSSVTTFREAGLFPNEPVFVPAPGATTEDEGVVLSLAVDARDRVSRLLVLDAQSFAPRANVRLPQLLPFHFHGQFFFTYQPTAPEGPAAD